MASELKCNVRNFGRRMGASALIITFLVSNVRAKEPTRYTVSKMSEPLNCRKFERQRDGSWLSKELISVDGFYNGVRFRSQHGLNTVLRKGELLDGLDLASVLDRQCPSTEHE